jgi:hypothetical protein
MSEPKMRVERTGPIEPLTPRIVAFLKERLGGVSLDEEGDVEERPDFACLSRERHFVDEMNDRYCAVLEGSKFRIFRETFDTTFGTPRRLFARLTRADFLGFHENDRVMTPDGPGKSKAELWLKAPKRCTYEGLIMAPEGAPAGMLNLWQGWAVTARPGDWSRTRGFMVDVLASGDSIAGDYVVRCMA